MGCDIHAYVEYADKDREKPYWMTLSDRCNPGRNYVLFGKLAGVRTSDPDEQMIPLRGMPADLAMTTKWANELYASDGQAGEGEVSIETARKWGDQGLAAWTDDRKVSVSNPDWHSHSWCTTAELRAVLESDQRWPAQPAYWAVLAAMEELEKRDCIARLVFWFDN